MSKESVDVLAMCMEVFKEVQQNMEFTDEHIEKMQPMFDLMAKDIIHQRKRLGGNMVIAQAINSQKQRERMRKLIGPDLVLGMRESSCRIQYSIPCTFDCRRKSSCLIQYHAYWILALRM